MNQDLVRRWGDLLGTIGASPSNWRFSGTWGDRIPEWQVTLADKGIDVVLDEIEIDPETGHYLFQGQQVLIYIKFTNLPRETLLYDKAGSRRFHFRDCRTIHSMKDQNRFQRYVAISRTDGLFPVVSREPVTNEQHELNAPLGVCKNCLKESDYKGYDGAKPARAKSIWESFDIEEFFDEFASSISWIPVDVCSALDPKKYSDDWSKISTEVRQKAKWRCDECRVDLSSRKRLLHVHHLDHNKLNNWQWNLRPLCALCHKAQPAHQKMYVSFHDADLIRRLRRDQSLD